MPKITPLEKKAVFEFRRENVSIERIANQLDLAKSTVQLIIKKGENNITNKKVSNCGRKSKLSARQKRAITIESKKHPFMTANQIRSSLNLTEIVSVDTIKRTLRDHGLFGRISAKKPRLSAMQIKRRLEWCKSRHAWNITGWSKVIYSDECPLYLNCGARQYVRRPPKARMVTKYVSGTVKFPKILMVWGAVRFDGKRVLCRCNGNVDSFEYQRILRGALPQIYTTRYLFQHDGAPCHRSASTARYLEQEAVRMLQNWPPQSPDLNVIENLWSIMKDKLKERQYNTLDELWTAANDIWSKIPNDTIMKLYQSIPNRIKAVVDRKGHNTSY